MRHVNANSISIPNDCVVNDVHLTHASARHERSKPYPVAEFAIQSACALAAFVNVTKSSKSKMHVCHIFDLRECGGSSTSRQRRKSGHGDLSGTHCFAALAVFLREAVNGCSKGFAQPANEAS